MIVFVRTLEVENTWCESGFSHGGRGGGGAGLRAFRALFKAASAAAFPDPLQNHQTLSSDPTIHWKS